MEKLSLHMNRLYPWIPTTPMLMLEEKMHLNKLGDGTKSRKQIIID